MVNAVRKTGRLYRVAAAGVLAVSLIFILGLLMSAQAKKAPCPVPPMGWNSYNCWNYAVTEKQFMDNARYVASLKKYGWEYVVVDFIWWIPLNGQYGGNQSGNWNLGNMDQYGRFMPDTTRFPSSKEGRGFKPLADSVHNLGLKFGIHLMRGVPRMAVRRNNTIYNSTYTCTQAADQNSNCPWLDWMWGTQNNAAGQAYLTSMVQLCNDWGADYLKIDDLSAAAYHSSEVVQYANAIASVSREMVFSTSPGPTPVSQASHVSQYANMWRLVNDLWDTWAQLTDAYRVAEQWRGTTVQWGPGKWPDIDMLPFGHLALYGPVGQPRYSLSTYTKGEHKLMFMLWCVNNGPLMWGGNLPDNKDNLFYDSLMTNSDAIFINQRGIRGRVLKSYTTNTPVWTSTHPTDTTTKFVLLANIGASPATISVALNTIGITTAVSVKNVWTGATVGNFTTTFAQTIPSHDAGLYILGNGSTAVNLASPRTEKPEQTAGVRGFFTTGNRLAIPASFAGKTVKVAVYSLGGKLLNSIVTRDRSVQIYKGDVCAENVGIVKITEIR